MPATTTAQPFRRLAPGWVNSILPSRLQVMITGVAGISQDRTGRVTLHYQNGTQRSTVLPEELEGLGNNYLDLVRAVEKAAEQTPV